MSQSQSFVRLALGELDVALALAAVDRIVRAVAMAPLPGAPAVIRGLVTVHGDVLPVADLRVRFGFAPRPVGLADQLVIARTSRRPLALLAAAARGVVQCAPDDVLESAAVVPGLAHVHGVARMHDGLLLVHDLDRFLSLDEVSALDEAIQHA